MQISQLEHDISHAKQGNELARQDLISHYKPYSRLGDFSEGLAAVKLGGKWGFINQKGTFMIKPQFTRIKQ